MISPGKHKCRNGWEASVSYRDRIGAQEFWVGDVHSPVCGYWIKCTWTLEGKCWYGEQLDIEETK